MNGDCNAVDTSRTRAIAQFPICNGRNNNWLSVLHRVNVDGNYPPAIVKNAIFYVVPELDNSFASLSLNHDTRNQRHSYADPAGMNHSSERFTETMFLDRRVCSMAREDLAPQIAPEAEGEDVNSQPNQSVKRRSFLKDMGIAGVALTAGSLLPEVLNAQAGVAPAPITKGDAAILRFLA